MKKSIIESLKNTQLFEEQCQIKVAMQQALKQERELDDTLKKIAGAEKYRVHQETESIRIKNQVEVGAIRAKA